MPEDTYDIEHEVWLALTYITGQGVKSGVHNILTPIQIGDEINREKRARLAVVRVLQSEHAAKLHGALARAFADELEPTDQDSLKIHLHRRELGRPTNERSARSIAERVMDLIAPEYEQRRSIDREKKRSIPDRVIKAACLEVAKISERKPSTVESHFKEYRDKLEMERGFFDIELWRQRQKHIREKRASARKRVFEPPRKTN